MGDNQKRRASRTDVYSGSHQRSVPADYIAIPIHLAKLQGHNHGNLGRD
jgi:hypothetical protein